MPEQKKPVKNPLLEAWDNHPTRRVELSEILKDPAMIDALNIIRSKIFEPRPMLPGTPDPIKWAALHGQRREGGFDFLMNFMQLAQVRLHKLPEKKAWETSDRDSAIAKMREDLPGTEVSPPPSEPVLQEHGPAPVEPSTTDGPTAPVT